LVFFGVDDVDQAVRTLASVGQTAHPRPSANSLKGLSRVQAEIERRFTFTRRVLCGLLGVALLASFLPVVALRYLDYLEHSPTLARAGTVHLTLAPDTYVIFEHTHRAGPYDCSPTPVCVTIHASDVSVHSSTGSVLSVTDDRSLDGITDSGDHFAGAVLFTVRARGTFTITIHSAARARFIVAEQPSEELRALSGWIAGAIIGGLLMVLALLGELVARGSLRAIRRH
jgi:hypothetical protein